MWTLTRPVIEKDRKTPRGAPHLLLVPLLVLASCSSPEPKPVDLYPEDMCAYCRMAVSDHRCASEILIESGEVYKFDDISCLEHFRSQQTNLKVAGIFVKEFETRLWLPWDKAVVIKTGVFTPMGSGKVAFKDSLRAREFLLRNPAGE